MVLVKIDLLIFKFEVGSVYEVKVIKMFDFGVVVEYIEVFGNEVLLYVFELVWECIENVSDVVNMGDVFDVKYFGVDLRIRKDKVFCKVLLLKFEGYVECLKCDDKCFGGRDNRGCDNRNCDRDKKRD